MIEPRYFDVYCIGYRGHWGHAHAMGVMSEYPDEFYCGSYACIPMNDVELIGQLLNDDAEWGEKVNSVATLLDWSNAMTTDTPSPHKIPPHVMAVFEENKRIIEDDRRNAMNPEKKRWFVRATYAPNERSDVPVIEEYYIEELYDLHDIIEAGPDFGTVTIEIRYAL